VLEEPVTVAVNCWVVATTTLCVFGATTTVTELLPPKPRRLLMLQPAQQKQERTKRTVVRGRMPAPSLMPDDAERCRNSVQSHTAVVEQLCGIARMLAMRKEGRRAKEI
jgi:hypothetical protein